MEVYAIVNQKGGVGKTTTASAMASGMALRGYRVLAIDLDQQANLTYSLGGKPGDGVAEVLKGEPIDKAIQSVGGVDLVPPGRNLASIDHMKPDPRMPYLLANALKPCKYDYAVLDTAPSLNALSILALTAASQVVITVQAGIYALKGVASLMDTIRGIQASTNRKLRIAGILLTRHTDRAVVRRELTAGVRGAADAIGTKVFATPIRDNVAVEEAQANQRDIFSYAPKSAAAKDYTAFLDELLEEAKP